MKLALLAKDGSDPEIEVTIGNAEAGRYKIELFNENTKSFDPIGAGASFDDVADKFTIGKLKELDNRLLHWDITILPFNAGPNEFYSATVTITQNNAPVPGGVYKYSGSFEVGAKIIFDMAQLVVK